MVGAGYGLHLGLDRDGGASPFTSTMLPGFEFDDPSPLEIVIGGDVQSLPTVDAVVPTEGTVGTRIAIRGRNLEASGLTALAPG
jgi:hypothetical protein